MDHGQANDNALAVEHLQAAHVHPTRPQVDPANSATTTTNNTTATTKHDNNTYDKHTTRTSKLG
jgi:hypothetical protein